MMTELMKENIGLCAFVFPQTINNAGVATDKVVDMSKFNRARFVVAKGTGVGNITAYLQVTNNSNGSGATNLATNTGASGTSVNQAVALELRSDQMNGYRYLGGWVQETAAAATVVGGILEATEPRFHPQDADDAAVAQNVAFS